MLFDGLSDFLCLRTWKPFLCRTPKNRQSYKKRNESWQREIFCVTSFAYSCILNPRPIIVHKPFFELIGRDFVVSVSGEFFSCCSFNCVMLLLSPFTLYWRLFPLIYSLPLSEVQLVGFGFACILARYLTASLAEVSYKQRKAAAK